MAALNEQNKSQRHQRRDHCSTVKFYFVFDPSCENHLFIQEEEDLAAIKDEDKDQKWVSAGRKVNAHELKPQLSGFAINVFDLSSDDPGPLPLLDDLVLVEGNIFIVSFNPPKDGGLVCARLPLTFRYPGGQLQAPCTDYVFESKAGSCTRFLVSLRPSNASIEVTSCAYTVDDDDDAMTNGTQGKRHIPLPGVRVRFFRIGERASSEAFEVTTDQFSSVVTNVSPGPWLYEYSTPNGYNPRRLKDRQEKSSSLSNVGQIEVKAGCVQPFHLCFEPTSPVVAGQVIYGDDEGMYQGDITLEGVTAKGVKKEWPTQFANDGSYRFAPDPAKSPIEKGTYQVRIRKLNVNGGDVPSDLFLLKTQTVTVPQSGFVQVPDILITPETVNDIDVAVTDDSGVALVGEWVELFDRTGKIKLGEALSDSEGRVRFSPGLRGLYYLRLKNDDAQLQPVEVQAR